jgi:MoaA/NifB/PqqE/SkfB family radical SAM enzyme
MKSIGKERTADEWISLGKQVANAGTFMLLITGGEPFLRPDFKQIYEALGKMGFLLRVYTNASLITEETIEWLSKIPPSLIRVTLYGASNDTYQKVCGDPHGFDRVVHGIELLQNANLPVALASTIINDNYSDLTAMKAFANEKHIPFTHTVHVVHPVRGAESSAVQTRLTDDDYAKCVINDFKGVGALSKRSYVSPLDRCRLARCGYWITWNGRMSVCSLMNDQYTRPFEIGFSPAWSELRSIVNGIKSPNECLSCQYNSYCTACIGTLSAETGQCDKISDRMCNAAKLLYESNILSKP